MNRKEAAELSPFIKAFGEGRIIESSSITDVSKAWREVTDFPIGMIKNFKFRIKPDSKAEAKFRPFANVEECWTEMKKHQPFGWVKDKKEGYYVLITAVDNGDYMSLSGNSGWSFYSLMKDYTFTDDIPFGIKVE